MSKNSVATPAKQAKKRQPRVDFKLLRGWIRDMRIHRKYSQKELATRSGYSQQFISSVESGEIELDITILFRLCDALDCDLLMRMREAKRMPKEQPKLDLKWEEIAR